MRTLLECLKTSIVYEGGENLKACPADAKTIIKYAYLYDDNAIPQANVDDADDYYGDFTQEDWALIQDALGKWLKKYQITRVYIVLGKYWYPNECGVNPAPNRNKYANHEDTVPSGWESLQKKYRAKTIVEIADPGISDYPQAYVSELCITVITGDQVVTIYNGDLVNTL